jgi:ABC-type transport system involved in multi-copper enzyme maturation permease subunit
MTAWTIAGHQLRELLAGRYLLLMGLGCGLLVALSLGLLAHDYQQRKLGYDRRDATGQTRAGKRPKLSAPPAPLSALVQGLEAHNGRLLIITWSQPRRQPGAAVMDPGDPNPLFALFRAPDLAHLVQFFLSLLALFLVHDAVCGERQQGTLWLVFAGPVSRGAFLMGKAAGALLGLLVCLAPSLLALGGGLLLWLDLGMEDWLRAGGILLCSLLYLGLFLQLGLWVSALVARPATALLVLLGAWTVWVVGLPNVAMPLSRWLRPFPAVEQLEAEKSQLRQGDFASYLDFANTCWAIDDRYVAQVDRQIDLAMALSRLSPLAAYAHGTAALAHTGVEDARRFRDAVVRWDRLQRRVGYHWEAEIPFAHQFHSLEESWDLALADLGLLALWNVLFLSAAFYVFLRRDIA